VAGNGSNLEVVGWVERGGYRDGGEGVSGGWVGVEGGGLADVDLSLHLRWVCWYVLGLSARLL
jgi:hypothetical protein